VLGSLYDIKPTALDQVTKRNYEVKEKVNTAFVKANIDTDIGGTPVRGNLGVQFIHTDQSSHGFSRLDGIASETTRGTTYNDVLPSLNLNFDLGGDRHIRTGLAKTLARGRMDDMRAGADVSINTTGIPRWSGSGGNPELQPWRATSADLSFEQYFGKRSYVAVAGFYKKLKSYIYNRTLLYDFSGIPNTTSLIPAGNLGDFTRPENGNGGEVKGVEVSGAIEGNLIAKALDGFGALASASHTESNVSPNGPGTSEKLPGLSGVVASLTAYYEKAGFSARVSERYRSKFRGEITGVFIDRQFSEILADKQTDAQMSYEFSSGSLKGLSVLLQVNNLTNSPYATRQGTGFSGDTIAPERYDTYGRQYLLGFSYKM
jgi:iron complex outermembrane receptor protein